MFSDYHLAISFLLCPSKIVSNIQQQDTQTHPFNGPLSGTTHVSRYQKQQLLMTLTEAKLDFTEARDSEWQ